jgi:hypothetical protein
VDDELNAAVVALAQHAQHLGRAHRL